MDDLIEQYLGILINGSGLLAIFLMREDFWVNTFELPCPEEGGEVKVFGQLVERDVVTDGDTSLIGYLEVGCRPITGVAFTTSFGDRHEVFFRVG